MCGEHMRSFEMLLRPVSWSAALRLPIAMVAVTLSAQDGYRRDQFGTVSAEAVEAVMRLRSPGSRVRWEDKVWLVPETGSAREIFLPGFLQRPEHGGFLFATGLEFPEEQRRVKDALASRGVVSGGGGMTSLLVFRTTSTGSVQDLREGPLDSVNSSTECLDLQVRGRAGGAWPSLEVRYRSHHATTDGVVTVEWNALIDSESMRMLERTPSRIGRLNADGTRSGEVLRATRGATGSLEIRGLTRGHSVTIACSARCVVDAESVVNILW
jgi:hypothetical protein